MSNGIRKLPHVEGDNFSMRREECGFGIWDLGLWISDFGFRIADFDLTKSRRYRAVCLAKIRIPKSEFRHSKFPVLK
jgi:hypothetical protein